MRKQLDAHWRRLENACGCSCDIQIQAVCTDTLADVMGKPKNRDMKSHKRLMITEPPRMPSRKPPTHKPHLEEVNCLLKGN